MTLHENRELFAESIEAAAEFYHYDASHVEKDYWVSKMLKDVSLSQYSDKAYFKGGTSLSKAYGLIHRFSEDLDMLAYTGDIKASKSQEKSLNKKVSEVITDANKQFYKPDMSESGGNFRKLYFDYNSIYQSVGLKEFLEVEIKACDLPETEKSNVYYPFDKKMICPIVGSFLMEIGQQNMADEYGLKPFEIKCISPHKTICDKISRMVKLSYKENYIDEFAKHIRDMYDLHAILSVKDYKDFLNSDKFLEAMYKTTVEDKLMKNTKTDKPLNEALIFADTDSILSENNISKAYYNNLGKLFFNNAPMPSLEQIKQTINDIAARMPDFEVYRQQKETESMAYQTKPAVEYTKISVYSDSSGINLFIRCKADGVQMQGTKLSAEDKELYLNLLEAKQTDKLEELRLRLADKYFSDNIMHSQSKTIGR